MRIFWLYIVCFLFCATICAQDRFNTRAIDSNEQYVKSDSITVSLVTYYPGSLEYELYGHAGVKVSFADGQGVFYNYGIFDFNSPNFVYRFIKGETDYMVKGYSTEYMLRGYDRRKVVEQVFDLTQEQARKAYEYLAENALPWNATYRYNYVLDNCSTRPRDVIEMATGGTLKYPVMQDTTTFRKMFHRYNTNYAWSRFGIDMALGTGIDRTITYREQMFVPMVLMEACAGATIERDGKRIPLVRETIVLNEGDEKGDILPPTQWWLTPLCIFVVLLVIMSLFTWRDLRRGAVTRWVDSVMYGMMSLYGMLLFFLMFISTHEATSPNWNGVWVNPFYLLPAILVWIKSAKKLLYCYHFANFAVLIAFLIGVYWIPQEINVAVYPLILCLVMRSANYLIICRKTEENAK